MMGAAKISRGTYLLMEDRKNDWLAQQLQEEKRAQARINAMFGIRFSAGTERAASSDARALRKDHFENCDAGSIKAAHAANCDAKAVRNNSVQNKGNSKGYKTGGGV
jgi:hypothetical protein